MKAPNQPRPRPRLPLRGRELRKAVYARRRTLVALCAAIAVFAALQALRPGPGPQIDVVVAATSVDAGATLSADDLAVRSFPADAAPEQAYDTIDSAVGRIVNAPMRNGEPVTDMRLLQSGLLAGYPDGNTLTTVRITDPAALWGVEVGQLIDVTAMDPQGQSPAEVVVAGAHVVALPGTEDPDAEPAGGAAVSGVPAGGGSVVVLSVPEADALALADAAVRTQLGVLIRDHADGKGSVSDSDNLE